MLGGCSLPFFMAWNNEPEPEPEPESLVDAMVEVMDGSDTEGPDFQINDKEYQDQNCRGKLIPDMRKLVDLSWMAKTPQSKAPNNSNDLKLNTPMQVMCEAEAEDDASDDDHKLTADIGLCRGCSSLSQVKVHWDEESGDGEVEVEVDMPEDITLKPPVTKPPATILKSKHVTFTEECTDHLRNELHAFLKKQKKKGKSRKVKKELKKHLKKALIEFISSKAEAADGTRTTKKQFEKAVGEMINKAILEDQEMNDTSERAGPEAKESKKKKKERKDKKKRDKSKKKDAGRAAHVEEVEETKDIAHQQHHAMDVAQQQTAQTEVSGSVVVNPIESSRFEPLEEQLLTRDISALSKVSVASSMGSSSKLSSLESLIQAEYQRLQDLEDALDAQRELKEKAELEERMRMQRQEDARRKALESNKEAVIVNDEPLVQSETRSVETNGSRGEGSNEDVREQASKSTASEESPPKEITVKQKELEEEIATELAKLQALQNDFVSKVQMAKVDRESVLKSDLFAKNVFSGHAAQSDQKNQDEDGQVRGELRRLREEQKALFARSRELMQRDEVY